MSEASNALLTGTTAITELDRAWTEPHGGPRVRALRTGAERLRERIVGGPRCLSVRTLPITTLPYPTKYALGGALISPFPLLTMTHRTLLVQFLQKGAVKTLLFNPTDVDGAAATPYFAKLRAKFGEVAARLLTTRFDSIEVQLARFGLSADDVDYVAFDHFHTQDLRRLLGTNAKSSEAPRFKNATLLAPAIEWNDWDELHPMQEAWFVRDGKRGVRTEKVALTKGDLELGSGVYLLRTPGHTVGNQTLFMHTDSGIWGTSENGTCADNWSPGESKMRGLASTANLTGVEVLLNANTPELARDQYGSMILEKTLVCRVKQAPAFVQMFPSSEVTPNVFSPGITPSWLHKSITSGAIATTRKRVAA